MKRIIATTIIAVLLSAISISAQEVKATYIIDGQKVENFNGSQLAGKTISSYTVNDNVHVITTTGSGEQIPTGIKVTATSRQDEGSNDDTVKVRGVNLQGIVYVIDGEVTSPNKFMSMSASNIESMSVIKFKDDPNFKKYAEANTEAVIMISTKK